MMESRDAVGHPSTVRHMTPNLIERCKCSLSLCPVGVESWGEGDTVSPCETTRRPWR